MPETLTSLGSAFAVASGIGVPLGVAWFAMRSTLSQSGLTAQTAFITNLQAQIAAMQSSLDARKAEVVAADARADAADRRADETEQLLLTQRMAHRKEIETRDAAHHAAQIAWQKERHSMVSQITALGIDLEDCLDARER